MEDIIVTAIYCDDIRSETGGKLSYMGAYNSDLVVPEFPAQLTKLCIQVAVRLPKDTRAQDMTIKVVNGTETMAEVPFPNGSLQTMLAAALEASKDFAKTKTLNCSLSVQFGSLQIGTPCVIELVAVVDGVEIRGNSLRVRLPTEAELRQAPAPAFS